MSAGHPIPTVDAPPDRIARPPDPRFADRHRHRPRPPQGAESHQSGTVQSPRPAPSRPPSQAPRPPERTGDARHEPCRSERQRASRSVSGADLAGHGHARLRPAQSVPPDAHGAMETAPAYSQAPAPYDATAR